MRYILQIDTSGDAGAVLVSAEGTVHGYVPSPEPRDHAGAVHGMIDRALSEAGTDMQQLQAVAVCAGPGSYTGLRIGMAVAKGLCYALGIPLLLHNRLMLTAAGYRYAGNTDNPVLVAFHAREGECFAACYAETGSAFLEPVHIQTGRLAEWLVASGVQADLITDIPDAESKLDTGILKYIAPSSLSFYEAWAGLVAEGYRTGNFAELEIAEPFYMKNVFINNKL